MSELLVRARRVGRTFGSGTSSVAALRDASFEIRYEDRIAIAGPSGSGKSTLLHVVAGLDDPTDGEIAWPAFGDRSRLRPGPVAIAFQGPSMLPPLTILENVQLPLVLGGGEEAGAAQTAEGLLERFELGSVADKLPEEVSGGQAQRAGIARALASGPRLMLADEPTGQQDRAGGARLLETMLNELATSDAALVVATHDLEVADRLGERWRLEAGSLAVREERCSA